MKSFVAKLTSKNALSYINQVGGWYKSLPHLPKSIVEFFVKIAPYLAIFSAIVGLFFGPIVTLLSLAFIFTKDGSLLFISTLILSILFFLSGLILLLAFGPLKKRQEKGWILLFWAQVAMSFETVVRIVFGQTKILSLLGAILVFYVLFEMRSYYKKK